MKFTALTVAIFAAGACARMAEAPARVYERDIDTIKKIINNVGKGLDDLSSAADSYSGDPQPLVKAAQAIIQTIKNGEKEVAGSEDLGLKDALDLTSPVEALQAKGENLVAKLKSRKSEIEAAGQCETASKLMTEMNSNSQGLIKAVVSKVPKEAQSISENLAKGLQSAMDKGQNEFRENNCKNTGGQSSSAAGSSAPASSADSSAAASSAPASRPAGSSSVAGSSAAGSGSAPATSAAATGAPHHTGGASTKYQPTGTGVPTHASTQTGVPVVTAGAALVAPAGAIAAAIAAMVL